MAKWLAKEFDWDTGRYTGNYYDIAEAGIVAVFVDSFYGLDTNAGTAAAPFKTLGKAITYLNANGANGSRIFMNGIFSENLPTQTYWYEFIGCGGGRNGKTVWSRNAIVEASIRLIRSGIRTHNVELLNYQNTSFYNAVSESYFFVNCFLKNVMMGTQSSSLTRHHYGVLKNIYAQTGLGGNVLRLYDSVLINYINNSGSHNIISGPNNFLENIDSGSNAVTNSTTTSLKDIIAQFINTGNDDYSVRITSPLLGAGTVDEITGIAANVGGVEVGLPYNGISPEFTTEGGATITDLTIDSTGRFTITAPATTGTLETALMDLGNIYPLENIDLFNVFDFLSGEITQGVFETFSSPRMALTIKLKYGLTSSEVDDCPWLLIEYGKQPTYSGTGSSRVGNADDTFDPDTFQTIACRYMKLFITLQNNS